MTEKDKALVEKARDQRWEDIDEDAAETEEGRAALHDIAISTMNIKLECYE